MQTTRRLSELPISSQPGDIAMARPLVLARMLLTFIALLIATMPAAAQGGGDRTIANEGQKVVEEVVGNKGHTFLEQGSWINEGKNFKPTSDMDMEHLVKSAKPTDASKVAAWEKDLVDKWRTAQKDMIEAVKAKYSGNPDKIKEMLGKMNVYPPNQIMDECKSSAEAMEKFKKYNMVPNLGMTEELAEDAGKTVADMNLEKLNKSAEGLYGKDARRWIQNDRMNPGNGRVVYPGEKPGQALSSRFTDLEHLGQGGGTYTARGSANVSGQFVDKIFDDLRAGKVNPKNLERLKEELKILKAKSSVHIDLSDFEDAIKTGDIGKAKDLLAGAKLQLEFLKNANTAEKLTMIEKLLVKGGKASEKLMDMLSKVPVGQIVTVVDGMLKVFQGVQMGVDISKGNYVKALTNLGLALSPAAISILGGMTQEMLEAAKELGIRLVSGRQDCLDMLSGIYPDNPVYVVGSSSPDVSMEFLLQRYASCDESTLSALISAHAGKSSDKPDVAAANDAKCQAQIVPQWKEARVGYGKAFKEMAASLVFDIGAKIKEAEKKTLKDDIAALTRLREEFMKQYDGAQRNGDLVQRYTDAFQNAIGAKDANPCKNPSVAYFWRMANSSFDAYGDHVKAMSDAEYRMQTKTGALKSALDALAAPGDTPPPETRDVTARFVYQGPSFETMKPQLDAYGKMVSGEGGTTTYSIRWYVDGSEKDEFSDIAEFTGLEPGPHIIEASLTLFPIGPKDQWMTGMEYRAEMFNGVKLTIPEPPASDPVKEKDALVLQLKEIQEVWLPQISGMLTEHMNRTGSLGDLVSACNEQIRAFGCDQNELETIGNTIAENGIDPDDLANAKGEICGDGVDNNGNGLIDEGCNNNGSVVITVWDSGSLADDSFSLSVTGYGNLGSTPAGGRRTYSINLPPGTYTATLTCILAPDNAGTYTISFSGGASGSGGSGSFSGTGASTEFPFVVN